MDLRFIASTCSFKIRRGAGRPAAVQHIAKLRERTDQSGGNDDVDLLSLGEEESHLRIDEFLLVSTSVMSELVDSLCSSPWHIHLVLIHPLPARP